MLHPDKELAEYLDGELSDDRRPALERHLKRCKRCRRSVDEYRDIQERLRALDVPPPGQDLTARILRCNQPDSPTAEARPTGTGARGSNPAEAASLTEPSGAPGDRPGSVVPGADFQPAAAGSPAPDSVPAGKRSPRLMVVLGGVMAGCAVVALSAAYVLGGEAQTAASGSAPSLAWAPIAGNAAAVRPVALDSSGLEALRRSGWTCPLLLGLGYHLHSAEQLLLGGQPAVKIDLRDSSHRIVITEQRRTAAGGEGPGSTRATPPLNAATGHPVTMDGFQQVAGLDRSFWVRGGKEWTVVLDSEEVTYTLRSDLPLAEMPDTVSQVVLTENSRLEPPPPAPPDDPLSRIIRGLGMMVRPPASG